MFNVKTFALVASSILALFLSFSALSETEIIYKWVDAKGNVKYTQNRPEGDIKYQIIRYKRNDKKVTPSIPKSTSSSAKISKEEISANSSVQDVARKNQEIEKKNCEISKSNLETLQGKNRIKYKNEAGEEVFLNDEERAERIQQAKDNVARYCK